METTRFQVRYLARAVVVAQLVERSLPTPEIRGSNPNIGKIYLPIVIKLKKTKIKKKRPGMAHLSKKKIRYLAAWAINLKKDHCTSFHKFVSPTFHHRSWRRKLLHSRELLSAGKAIGQIFFNKPFGLKMYDRNPNCFKNVGPRLVRSLQIKLSAPPTFSRNGRKPILGWHLTQRSALKPNKGVHVDWSNKLNRNIDHRSFYAAPLWLQNIDTKISRLNLLLHEIKFVSFMNDKLP